MNIKIDQLQAKKQYYKKHLERLSTIYDKQKLKKKVVTQYKSVDKLMAITHRLHDTSNNFRVKKIKQIQRQITNKDWSAVNCSILTPNRFRQTFKKKAQIEWNNQKCIKQRKAISKQNQTFMMRLINVKPTIQTNSIMKKTFLLTQRTKFLNNLNQTQIDFSSILNNSIIKKQQQSKILIKLHLFNQQIIKLKFSQELGQVLSGEKLYFFEIKNNKDKIIQSKIFNAKELMESRVYLYKLKQQNIQKIQIKQLYKQMKPVLKGSLNIGQINLQSRQQQQFCQFMFPNKKTIKIGFVLQRKNLKAKHKILEKQNNIRNKIQEKRQQQKQNNHQFCINKEYLNNKGSIKKSVQELQNIINQEN